MSTIHRPHGGADEGNSPDHPARLGGFEERLLAELKQTVAQHAAATTHPQPRRLAGRGWPARPLLLTGAASAALAAGLAVALTVASAGGPVFAPASTAPAVLHNAVLAALHEPAVTPRPGQFVYSKVYMNNASWPGPEVNQTWLPVSGARFGLESQTLILTGGRHATWTHPVPVCVNGVWKFPPGYTPDITKLSRFRPSCTRPARPGTGPACPPGPPPCAAGCTRSTTTSSPAGPVPSTCSWWWESC
jgi:hypothetical protein